MSQFEKWHVKKLMSDHK